ncbi:MAG: phenylacetate-CoA oxygenase subunit PaaC [Candidatus Kapabacteria bacterium]|jgi:ring-1,2-phenylacetyl-CoA epoxidase subunit PaaC|nr:phenylacetate-CoA oxygenase subunit PaaC [Candidatus Kapabacteria bacterium]
MKTPHQLALKDLLFKMADDCLILGHRNSEWVGIGPMLEEDIAFASIAQDKLGHALALYTILHDHCEEPDADTLAFMRGEGSFRCCHFVEIPTQEYDFALVRHFLFDTADHLRFEMLTTSAFEPLAQLARKVKGEIAYHTMHANIFIRTVSNGSEEAKFRMQSAFNEAYPLALGIFEESPNEQELMENGIFGGERHLFELWLKTIQPIVHQAGLKIPSDAMPVFGGRKGYHTEHLTPLLEEMSEVFAQDPSAEW